MTRREIWGNNDYPLGMVDAHKGMRPYSRDKGRILLENYSDVELYLEALELLSPTSRLLEKSRSGGEDPGDPLIIVFRESVAKQIEDMMNQISAKKE